jgi:hypothetical protein
MSMLRAAIRHIFSPGTSLATVNDSAALQRHLNSDSLLLVNRALDGDFDTDSGIELIRSIAQREANEQPAMMLISNYPEAQEEAVKAGARPGFGKSALYSQTTATLLRQAATAGE